MKKANRKKLNIVIFTLIVIVISVVGVYAERIIASNIVTYDNKTSKLSSTNVQGAIDELYAKCVNGGATFNFAKYLQSLESSGTIITDDGTADHNMRYIGKSPNNYVTFAGEEWRVIGSFNNISNGSGKVETRVKIIRVSGSSVLWNSSNVNIWKSSSLNTELQKMSYATNGLIENAVWYLGDAGGNLPSAKMTYEKERSTTVASGNDPTWTGKVGLMYPSDYGFASSACKDGAKTLYEYNATDIDCKGTDWLYWGIDEWILSPNSSSSSNSRHVVSTGYITHNPCSTGLRGIRPVVYLKANVTCKNCWSKSAGTKDNPFQIG